MKKTLIYFVIISIVFISGAFVGKMFNDEKLTVSLVQQAGKIFGIEFTVAEADSMLTDLESHRTGYENIRKINIDNSVSPTLVFDPLPTGFVFPDDKNSFIPSKIKSIKLPKNTDDLAFYTVRELAELIRTKQISSVELTKFYIDRIKKYNPTLLNTVTITEELAMKQAATADAEIKAGKYRGLLHGIPYGAKDLLSVNGYKTTWGSVPFKDQVLEVDATVIKKLEEAGAVLVAKLTLGELAWGDVWFGGKTLNPWDLKRGSSGSSAGSASAVAGGLLPFAIGSETLGSIVSPSSECGTTGLRPTFGRVSKHGAMALSWSMDKLGPITRSVEDAAIVFNAIYGADGKDLSVIDAGFDFDGNRNLKGIRIGYLKSDFDRNYPNKKTDSATLVTLRSLGAELIPIQLPAYPVGNMVTILYAESAAAFDELTRSGKDDMLVRQIRNAWPNVFRAGRFIPAVEYIQANRLRSMLIEDMHKMMKDVDVYISPSFASSNLTLTNLSGHPCVVLPNGFRANGTPMSITFMGQLFGEGKLLTVAKAYQDATDFHKKHPNMNF